MTAVSDPVAQTPVRQLMSSRVRAHQQCLREDRRGQAAAKGRARGVTGEEGSVNRHLYEIACHSNHVAYTGTNYTPPSSITRTAHPGTSAQARRRRGALR